MLRRPQSVSTQSAKSDRPSATFEKLEARQLMSAALPAFKSFTSTAGLTLNGYAPTGTINKGLVLTDGNTHEARSVWWDSKVSIDAFSTSFTYASTANPTSADGFTFAIQNHTLASVGHDGGNLGLRGISKSVGAAFNLYNDGSYGTNFGFSVDGAKPPPTTTTLKNIDLHNGDTYGFTIAYDGTNLSVKVVDENNTKNTFSASQAINIPKLIGGHSGYVGFTSSTGVQFGNQKIRSWSYGYSPTFTTKAAAAQNPVEKKKSKFSTTLSALATDPRGAASLKYTWTVAGAATGARTPTFSVNGTNASSTTAVRFFNTGTYSIVVTATDTGGFSSTSTVSVVVG